VDRLSRSLLDFAQLMRTFEQRKVSFVSITQQFNTATSMGRLVLNVLLSFAQFEREIISERTRDKIAATRRKGKWAGGHPQLGYDVNPAGYKLTVNTAESVRQIFALYLEHESLLPVVEELARRKWVGKRWKTRKGPERGGQPFTRTSLYRLLTNVVYAGKVRYKSEVHDGEHPAMMIGLDRFRFYENGIVSLNLPPPPQWLVAGPPGPLIHGCWPGSGACSRPSWTPPVSGAA
jgi:site-specific DNA recombinase